MHLSVFRERRSVHADQEGWLREAIASGLKIEKSRDGFPSLHRDKRQTIADFSQIRPPKRQRGELVSLRGRAWELIADLSILPHPLGSVSFRMPAMDSPFSM